MATDGEFILFDGKKYRFFVWQGTGHVVLTSQGALELKRVFLLQVSIVV